MIVVNFKILTYFLLLNVNKYVFINLWHFKVGYNLVAYG